MPNNINNNRNGNNNRNRRVWWPWILTGGMIVSALIMRMCGNGCPDCRKPAGCDDCKQKTEIKVDGDAVIINDSQETNVNINKGNGNRIDNANKSTVVTPRPKPKPQPKPEPKPQPKPKPVQPEQIPVRPAPDIDPVVKPDPEPDCKTVVTKKKETFVFTGSNAKDAALRMLDGYSL